MAELILSGDSLNTGRIAINNWYSGSSALWTSGTGSDSIRVAGGNSTAGGSFSFAAGKTNAASSTYGLSPQGLSNNVASTSIFGSIINGKTNTNEGAYALIGDGLTNSINSTGNKALIGNGSLNQANHIYASVLNGKGNVVSQQHSVIISGKYNTINGSFSFIGNGNNNTTLVGGQNGFVGTGTLNRANGANCSAVINGFKNYCTGLYSFITTGRLNHAYGSYSFAHGVNNVASHAHSLAIGVGATSNGAYQMVFSNGGGSNTIRLKFLDGVGSFEGGTDLGPADYAEYFEWEDGNPNNDKRFGYAVSLVNDGKIQIGGSNIIGIISAAPAIVGDSAEFAWSEKYLIDEWGTKEHEEYKSFYSTELGTTVFIDSNNRKYSDISGTYQEIISKEITSEITIPEDQKFEIISKFKLNPLYTGGQNYIPRSQRKEWNAVGLLGKIRIRTKERITGQFIDINSEGVAVNGSKYRILKQIKEFNGTEGIVLIFFK